MRRRLLVFSASNLDVGRAQREGVVGVNVQTLDARVQEGVKRMYEGLHKTPVDSYRPIVPEDFKSVDRPPTSLGGVELLTEANTRANTSKVTEGRVTSGSRGTTVASTAGARR